jgi:hypothetical protein
MFASDSRHATKCSNASEYGSMFRTVLGYLRAYLASFCLLMDLISISSGLDFRPACKVR